MKNTRLNLLVAILASATLVACNGGGGKGNSTPAAPSEPKKEAPDKPKEVVPKETDEGTVKLKDSSEKTLIDETRKIARQAKKKMMIIMHDAESIQSAYMHERVNSKQSDFRKELERNFEIIDFEKMHLHSPEKILDFLPGGSSIYYPAIYLHDPVSKKWAILPIDPESEENMKPGIKMFLDDNSTFNAYSDELDKMLRDRNVKFFNTDDKSRRNLAALAQIMASASMELDKKDFYDLDRKVSGKLGPSRIDKNVLALISLRNWQTMIGRDQVGYDEVLKDLNADQRLIVTTTSIGFHAPMAKAVRWGNNLDSIKECEARKTDWHDNLRKNARIQTQSTLGKQESKLRDIEKQVKAEEDVLKKWDLKKKVVQTKLAVESLKASLASAELEMDLSCIQISARQGRAKAEDVTAELNKVTGNKDALNFLRPLVSVVQAFQGDFAGATKTRQDDVTEKLAAIDKVNKELNTEVATLEKELNRIKDMDDRQADFDKYSKEVDAVKEIVRLNNVVKTNIQTAFDQLKKAWADKKVVVERN